MDLWEAMRKRHSVRAYTDRPIEAETLRLLEQEIGACNRESGLHLQLAANEPEAFGGGLAHYGSFRNVRNYIVLAGPKGAALEEQIGYYGERIVLKAQQLGLNTCWVGLTYRRRKARCTLAAGEKLVCVLALGYGAAQGRPHKNRPLEQLCRTPGGEPPEWFAKGMEAALLAPTAVNQQKFRFTLEKNGVKAESLGGPYAKVDLGIVKYHFEAGAGKNRFAWL